MFKLDKYAPYAFGMCDTYAYYIRTSCIKIYFKNTWSH